MAQSIPKFGVMWTAGHPSKRPLGVSSIYSFEQTVYNTSSWGVGGVSVATQLHVEVVN